ncbi:MAG: class I SAM-dependent methyltransferase [Gammaproteobacteria bacterium]|nr:class I SAM-dependent methyltransferase [Gammaproteobacteria bacterium]MYF59595.1 class I SAM-dependent methyltransferase [Gammaproteobacteria bacterium]
MTALYDRIGRGYADFRRPDPRIEKAVWCALGDARSVINVGAGAGSYEPTDRHVVAVEPSMTMIAQRPAGSAGAVQATASSLPFGSDSFDAAMAILSVHHWRDRAKGLRELRRVARDRVVVLTCDPESRGFWLTEYFPELFEIDRRIFPSFRDIERELGPVTVQTVPVPHDCTDGFLGSRWRRPHDYLDERVRGAMSTFSKLSDKETGLAQLSADLESGNWQRKYGALLKEAELDIGYRLLVAGV